VRFCTYGAKCLEKAEKPIEAARLYVSAGRLKEGLRLLGKEREYEQG
jgi:hypothetical protein